METYWDIAGQTTSKCTILKVIGQAQGTRSRSSKDLSQMINIVKILAFKNFLGLMHWGSFFPLNEQD